MQPGLSSTSELLDSLKVYLNNKNRLQPIIGLGSIIECVKVGARCREVSYLCEVCVCRLSKGDMRNHIMGSLHRYNYIRAWHPELVCDWKEKSDLSRLAWPLMEIAKTIEGKEGSGEVQLIEVEDVLYQKMATLSENDVVTLIKTVRGWQEKPESHSQTTSVQLKQHSLQSQRTVMLGHNQLLRSETSLDNDAKTSTQSNDNPPLTRSTAARAVKSEDWVTNSSTEVTVFSGSSSSSSFLDGYTGNKPLIGLGRVVECRSDTGCTCVFLCHCCRIKSNEKDIIDHLTGPSHLINYLMETHPEQDINDNSLQWLAKTVEREEGRGELKVINAPESLCIPLTGKSYHWCVRMLCSGWKSSTRKKTLTVREQRVNKTLVKGETEKLPAALSKRSKRKAARRKKRKVADTLFTVSLPLTKGPVVLQRTSFTKDSLPVPCSPEPAQDLFPRQESNTDDQVSEWNAASFAVDQTEHNLNSGDTADSQYVAGETNYTVTVYEMADGYSFGNEHFGHSNNTTERNYNTHCASQERSGGSFGEAMATEHNNTEGLSPAVPNMHISYAPEMGYAEQWHYQQLPQNHHMAPDPLSLLTPTVGGHGEGARWSEAAQVYTYPQLGEIHANSAPESSVYALGAEQRPAAKYTEFTAGQIMPQYYMMQPLAHPGVPGVPGVGGMSQSSAFIPPVSYPYYGTHADFKFTDTRPWRADDFQAWC